MIRANRMSNLLALVLAASLLIPSTASAVSMPYVDNIEDWGRGKVITTICAAGPEKHMQFKVTSTKTGKSVKPKVRKCSECGKKHVAVKVLKRGVTYKISVRAKDGKRWTSWRTIAYCVY